MKDGEVMDGKMTFREKTRIGRERRSSAEIACANLA